MKETVKERAILQEKITEGRINGKNAMTVSDINELKGHRGSAIHGIFITAGRAETYRTYEKNEAGCICFHRKGKNGFYSERKQI